MHRFFQSLANRISTRKGAWTVLTIWLVVIIVLSGVAPSSKKYAVSSGEGSIHENTPSAIAEQLMNEQFPTEDGPVGLLVFHAKQAITTEQRAKISEVSTWLASDQKPVHVSSALPFHKFPKQVQDQMFSEDQTTLLLNIALDKNLDSAQLYDTMQLIRDKVAQIDMLDMQFEITGPAGIAADTTSLFKNADFVLMFATVGLILIILIVIYRSPLMAVIPLIIAGLVYQVTDRILGLAAKNEWFVVDKQALSIMMILLFAVLTDYCLFIVARYREALKTMDSKYEAMRVAFGQVAEPIAFSGGTVLIAMLTLFAAIFKPYHNFAPVFSVAMVVILLGGLTLIPAIYTLFGRRGFWPFMPKQELHTAPKKKPGFWARMGGVVTRKPGITSGILLLFLILSSINVTGMNYSFNLMKSFPSDTSSRQGFELLEEQFPPGQLAPVTVLLQSNKEIVIDAAYIEKLTKLTKALEAEGGIHDIRPNVTPALAAPDAKLPDKFISDQKHTLQLKVTLQANPYDPEALDVVRNLQDKSESILEQADFDPAQNTLHFAGQTAQQLDVRGMNAQDTIVTFSLVTLLIALMLTFQARSIKFAVTMIVTMLLSYTATLGLGWIVFHDILGYDAISYRLPVYTFVFLIALGVDYNIMLVSRIREEAKHHPWTEAISRGVAKTGGVISSAGIILAATFCVLITQPLQELFLFGFTMAMGILIDTFLVRGMLLPALMTLLGPRSTSVKTPLHQDHTRS
ncbi:MMPL family transporter [Paenibacillus guangzhouensis]|uniref:MMPL family transporter n=1 Tax=Paenibacillus guangzhouensis TaxID=1473112 RepID=UPI001266F1A8|nr:MMPL family transporter [Paenibacillus guangzhouensis]